MVNETGLNPLFDAESCAAALEQSGSYRVLRRLRTDGLPSLGGPVSKPEGALRGVIVDTETTGRDERQDRIVELGMVLFDFEPATGKVLEVIGGISQLEDPGFPIPPEASRVNGITDEMVAGQRLDDGLVTLLVDDADLVIAHNAAFDRSFLERRLPVFSKLAWACSRMEINWEEEGIGGQKLDYLAYRYGFFYDAHRAVSDCAALLGILRQPLPASGVTGVKALYEQARRPSVIVYAEGAPFEAKRTLQGRGYRWVEHSQLLKGKAWGRPVAGDAEVEQEIDWLRASVYGERPFTVSLERLDCFCRHSPRGGAFSRRPA